MSRENLFKELKEVVMQLSKSKQEITEETNLTYDLGFDSILLIELFSEIEERYDAEFDFEGVDFEKIVVFENFVNYVASVLELRNH